MKQKCLIEEKETSAGNQMYGGAVSKAVDDSLVKSNNVKVGSYFKKVGGDFIRIGAKEGERLYAAGDPSISRSVIGNKESLAMFLMTTLMLRTVQTKQMLNIFNKFLVEVEPLNLVLLR